MPKLTLLPIGAGSLTDLLPEGAAANFECVDDVTLNNDEDFVYNDTLGTGKRDLYKLNASAIPYGATITSVTIIANLKRLGAGSSNGTVIIKDAGKVKVNPQIVIPTTVSYNSEAKMILLERPYGGVWTKAALAEIEVGLKLNCVSYLGSEIRCSRLRVEVDHT